jgi:hypothetical protein
MSGMGSEWQEIPSTPLVLRSATPLFLTFSVTGAHDVGITVRVVSASLFSEAHRPISGVRWRVAGRVPLSLTFPDTSPPPGAQVPEFALPSGCQRGAKPASPDGHGHHMVRRADEAIEQADEADEAFGGTVASTKVPPHARAGQDRRGHRFAAYPQCWADTGERG